MQQRQLRLGDILDDYCPRERRVTNHAVVAMIGEEVKQTRCTTCDAEHVYKQARVPRQRRKDDTPAALYSQVAAGAPTRVVPHGGAPASPVDNGDSGDNGEEVEESIEPGVLARREDRDEERDTADRKGGEAAEAETEAEAEAEEKEKDEGPVHRPLIRASLPRPEGQQPPARPIPEFTIRQPGGGRQNRFRPRHNRGGQGGQGYQGHQGHQGQGHQFHGNHGNRSHGNVGGPMRGPRPNAGQPGMGKRHGPPGRKRSK